MKKTICAICGNENSLRELYPANLDQKKINKKTFSARRLPDKIHYQIVKCEKCQLIFSGEIFSIDKIVKLYKESNFYYDEESKYLADTYYNYFKKYIKIKNPKILEIGSGNGFFLEKLINEGYDNVWGIEPGKPMVKKASSKLKNRIKQDVLRSKLFKKNSFDVICCFHTLDHIVDPNEFLRITYSLLKPKGKVFFVVHNTNGLSVKLFGEKSPIFDVEHVYLFSNKTLPKIFKINGFKKNRVFSHYNTYPISYWSHLLPMPKNVKKNMLAFLKKSRLGSIPVKLNPGNIGIIAEK